MQMLELLSCHCLCQVLGDELVEILRTQRHLESQFERLVGGGEGGEGNLREYAHSLASTAQGESMATVLSSHWFCITLVVVLPLEPYCGGCG